VAKKHDDRPLTFKVAHWYGIILSVMFLLYGGVKVVLGILDHTYNDLAQPIIFALVGLVLISIVFAYRELKAWGWYGLVGINSLVILIALFGFSHYENIVLLILSGIALYALLSPQTKQYLFKRQ
jgi:hypothetical protein